MWPARFPEAFSRMGITPASGVLLFGPPGEFVDLRGGASGRETRAAACSETPPLVLSCCRLAALGRRCPPPLPR